jgi:predicted Zn-dependent peptidase
MHLSSPQSAQAELLDALSSNSAIAAAFASYTSLTGDWRNVLADLRRIEGLEAGEVRDAAARHLRPDNVFKGYVLPA